MSDTTNIMDIPTQPPNNDNRQSLPPQLQPPQVQQLPQQLSQPQLPQQNRYTAPPPDLPHPLLPKAEQSLTEDNIRMNIDVDPTIMNKVMHDIHTHTSRSGAYNNTTSLNEPANNPNSTIGIPSNDIPKNSHVESLLQDETASPTYVPPPMPRYSSSATKLPSHNHSLVQQQIQKKKKREHFMDGLLDDIKLPILISLLYFIFQLPCTTTILRRVAPFFYQEDMNLNVVGMGSLSLAFAVLTLFLIRAQDEILSFFS